MSLAIAKRKGANAVVVADDILERLDAVQGQIFPADVEMTVTRNYGETANEKANELLFHLGLATISIVAARHRRHRLARGAGRRSSSSRRPSCSRSSPRG